jgi:hypothetical protein
MLNNLNPPLGKLRRIPRLLLSPFRPQGQHAQYVRFAIWNLTFKVSINDMTEDQLFAAYSRGQLFVYDSGAWLVGGSLAVDYKWPLVKPRLHDYQTEGYRQLLRKYSFNTASTRGVK